jgi:glycyl-tRNA synthetase beta chain
MATNEEEPASRRRYMAETKEFLLELGVEEIPAWMIPSALTDLKRLLSEGLDQLGLTEEQPLSVDVYATPRRLVAYIPALIARQPTKQELVEGPPKRVAFDASGNPATPAIKFAEKMGVAVEKLQTITTPKGEYLAYRKTVKGRPTTELLSELIPRAIAGIYFPRTMYWEGKSGPHFIRPIRWLVALYGGKVIPCSIGSVKAGKLTFGHRQLGKPKLVVKDFQSYRQALHENFVILDPADRRARVMEVSRALLTAEPGLKMKEHAALLETHAFLTEYPTPLLGAFDPSYLSLPEEVLITVMRGHQKYFAVEDAAGKLAPRFLAVMETDADRKGLIRHGHERVLRARFNDARFFWESDAQIPLSQRLELLRGVTFQAKLGSYAEKASRMQELTNLVLPQLGRAGGDVNVALQQNAVTAARLSKCDLTTDLVKEFTELQGIVGGLMARREGMPEEVAAAIYDHYRPESMEGPLPRTLAGDLVSLVDRMDTLVGCFGVGLEPSGSKDPFGLRRAAQGVIRILAEKQLPLTLDGLVGAACDAYGRAQILAETMGEVTAWKRDTAQEPLLAFLEDRLRYYLREVRGFAYDEVDAVIAATGESRGDVADVMRRIEALARIRPTENFEPLAAAFKRTKNILDQARATNGFIPIEVQENLLEDGPEANLYERLQQVSQRAASEKRKGDYVAALQAIASLRPDVDLFFDKILVMDKNEEVRNNRLSLLDALLTGFSTIADFSRIVPRESK